jgi:hypothetical protein
VGDPTQIECFFDLCEIYSPRGERSYMPPISAPLLNSG